MKKRMLDIMNTFHKYNSDNMAYLAFGLDAKEHYDALVVAPSYSPYKLKMDGYCKVTTLREGAYIAGYLVEKDGLKIELDVFHGVHQGLILAEVEFSSEEEANAYQPPEWFGEDVTFDGRYHNSYMSKLKF